MERNGGYDWFTSRYTREKKKEQQMAEIVLKRLGRAGVFIPIVGTAPLLQHRFSEKAKGMMLERQQQKAIEREPKDPDALYEAAMYPLPGDRYGHPSVAFKAAVVGARATSRARN